MKTTIKIMIIVLVAAGIAAAIWAFFNRINEGENKSIATTEFEKRIEAQVNNQLVGQSYNVARPTFDDIIATIDTEAKIETTDGQNVITESESDNCRSIAAEPYLPIFKNHANAYFGRSAWDDRELDDIRAHSKFLLTINGLKNDGDLKNYINNVNDFYSARSVIARSRRVTNIGDARKVIADANGYKRAPLNNNTRLMNDLNAVPSNAKESIVRSINHAIGNLATSPSHYRDYNAWFTHFDRLKKRIKEYTDNFGYNSELERQRTYLNNCDSRMEDYFINSNIAN